METLGYLHLCALQEQEENRSETLLATCNRLNQYAILLLTSIFLFIIRFSTGTALGNTTALQLGSAGDQVRLVQIQLNNWGFPIEPLLPLEVDGIFGARTQEAVRQFQAYLELPQTGTIDTTTSRLLWQPRITTLTETFNRADTSLDRRRQVFYDLTLATQSTVAGFSPGEDKLNTLVDNGLDQNQIKSLLLEDFQSRDPAIRCSAAEAFVDLARQNVGSPASEKNTLSAAIDSLQTNPCLFVIIDSHWNQEDLRLELQKRIATLAQTLDPKALHAEDRMALSNLMLTLYLTGDIEFTALEPEVKEKIIPSFQQDLNSSDPYRCRALIYLVNLGTPPNLATVFSESDRNPTGNTAAQCRPASPPASMVGIGPVRLSDFTDAVEVGQPIQLVYALPGGWSSWRRWARRRF